jgi:hypothetical protein
MPTYEGTKIEKEKVITIQQNPTDEKIREMFKKKKLEEVK